MNLSMLFAFHSSWHLAFVPNELHLLGCQFQCSDKSMFLPYCHPFLVAQILDGTGFQTQKHNVESDNT